MSPGIEEAKTAFREYVAHVLGSPKEDINVGSLQEEFAVTGNIPGAPEVRIGNAWAVYGQRRDSPARVIRGWALPDGTVITHDKNLGLLLKEAGVGAAKPTLDAATITAQIAWSMGTESVLGMNVQVREGPKASGLHLAKDGTGTLRFYVDSQAAGGPHKGGPPERYECTVTISANHSAVLKKSENLNR